MKFTKQYTRWVVTVVCVTLVFQLAACGTLIHPERKGQTRGRIDPAIAILDGIGLLFFLIPGIVAYAVDFSTGAIYLPPEGISKAPEEAEEDGAAQAKNRVVYVDPKELDAKTISRVIREETGVSVDIDEDYIEAYRYDDRDLMLQEMAKVNREIAVGHVMARAER